MSIRGACVWGNSLEWGGRVGRWGDSMGVGHSLFIGGILVGMLIEGLKVLLYVLLLLLLQQLLPLIKLLWLSSVADVSIT